MGSIAYLEPSRIPLALFDERIMSAVALGKAVAALSSVSLLTQEELDDGGFAVSVHRLVQAVMRQRLGEAGRADETAADATRLVERGSGTETTFDGARANARGLPYALAVLPTHPWMARPRIRPFEPISR